MGYGPIKNGKQHVITPRAGAWCEVANMKRMSLHVLKTWIGKKIHLDGCGNGAVWKVVSVEQTDELGYAEWFVNLVTPSTNRKFRALASNAQYLRADEPE